MTRKSGHIWRIWAETTQTLMPKSTKVAQIHLPECNSVKIRQISAKIRQNFPKPISSENLGLKSGSPHLRAPIWAFPIKPPFVSPRLDFPNDRYPFVSPRLDFPPNDRCQLVVSDTCVCVLTACHFGCLLLGLQAPPPGTEPRSLETPKVHFKVRKLPCLTPPPEDGVLVQLNLCGQLLPLHVGPLTAPSL